MKNKTFEVGLGKKKEEGQEEVQGTGQKRPCFGVTARERSTCISA